MSSLLRKLEATLDQHGWHVEVQSEDADWWVDERWRVRSTWSPVGFTVHVTFLVDPQHDGPRSKGAAVWAAAVSRTPPTSRAEAERCSHAAFRERNIEELVRFAGELRDAPGQHAVAADGPGSYATGSRS
jgi:hypothetical protein